jgi:predicted DNA-binding transcriptional regulator YafY
MVQQFLPKMLPKNCLVFLDPHFKQARAVLEKPSSRWLKTWPKKIGFVSRSQPLLGAKVDPEILAAITEGLLKDKKIRIQYSRKGEEVPAEGVINPLGIVFKDHIIYLACTYWEYKDIRHLVMHRMYEVEVLDEPMEKLEGFNLAEHIGSGAFEILEGKEKIKLKLVFHGGEEARDHPATHLRETPLSPDQRVTNLGDGKIQVEATVKDTSQLRWWLQGFGSLVEVLEPKELREEMAESAQKMAGRYK